MLAGSLVFLRIRAVHHIPQRFQTQPALLKPHDEMPCIVEPRGRHCPLIFCFRARVNENRKSSKTSDHFVRSETGGIFPTDKLRNSMRVSTMSMLFESVKILIGGG